MISICCASADEHVDACEVKACECRAGQTLAVFVEPSVASEPCESSLDNPSSRQQDEALSVARAFDDFEFWRSLTGQGVT